MRGHFELLYASQLGQAKSIAEDIQRDAALQYSLEVDFHCMDEYSKGFDIFTSTCIVIVCSTTGDGDVPDNAVKLWNALRKKHLTADSLQHLWFTVLGLGDTNYTNFCNGGKSINSRLLKLGAHHFYNPGWADDGTGLEVVVEPWLEGLWPALKKHLGNRINEVFENNTDELRVVLQQTSGKANIIEIMTDVGTIPNCDVATLQQSVLPLASSTLNIPVLPKTTLTICYDKECTETVDKKFPDDLPSVSSAVMYVNIASVTKLTNGDDVKKTLDLELEFGHAVSFEPGDSVGILCQNNTIEVEKILSCLDVKENSDCVCKITSETAVPSHLPCTSTLRHLLTSFCDIRSVPKKSFIRMLAEYTTEAAQKRRLQELCSKQGSSDYTTFVRNPTLSLLDFLLAFPECKPPIEYVIEQLPRLQPRAYSIVSSPLVNNRVIHIAFNVFEITDKNGRQYKRKGVCTGWLEDLVSTSKDLNERFSQSVSMTEKELRIPIYFRKNNGFRLPIDVNQSIIMIGPGTGVAPFVGFLQHLAMLKNTAKKWLFYGCRYHDRDYLYKSELKKYVNSDNLNKLFDAFSRDENSTFKYVQNQITANSLELVKLIQDENAVIYVCGDAKNMAKDVFDAIASAISQANEISLIESRNIVAQLQINKKYLQDVWA